MLGVVFKKDPGSKTGLLGKTGRKRRASGSQKKNFLLNHPQRFFPKNVPSVRGLGYVALCHFTADTSFEE
jgi:hypothetical protein